MRLTASAIWLLPSLVATLWLSTFAPAVEDGNVIRFAIDWLPTLGISLSFKLDGLSLTFALLISGIGVLIVAYSAKYMADHPQRTRFFAMLVLFMLSMLGLVLADNLVVLFVFWELTTITSYLLIGFEHAQAKARRSALQAILLTGAGGLALLAGIILLGTAAGTFELSEIRSQGDLIRQHEMYVPILALVLLGAFTKSAQFPFHFWLPNAMAAPTPISAYLHSATMVKAGIYLLARMHPTLSGTDLWVWTLTIFGALTAVLASLLALRQTDLKLMLAYTTVMALGTLTMFLGAEATVAIAAAVTFLIVHSFYKAALFLLIGNIDHGTGTRDIHKLGGLLRAMPVTAATAALAAFSMAGFPPFLGFIGKELKYEGALAIASEPLFVAAAVVTANALMVGVAGILAIKPFYGESRVTPKTPHEAPVQQWICPAILAALGLVFGLAPGLIDQTLVQPAVTAILGRPETVKLALWHGINVPLLLSVLTLAAGASIYILHHRLRARLAAIEARQTLTADDIWDRLLAGLRWAAARQTAVLQNGKLRTYLLTVFTTVTFMLGATFVARGIEGTPGWPSLNLQEWGAAALIVAGAIITVMTHSRLTAICALGVVGVGTALVFLMFGAPDVAITQLLIETLVVVLVAAVMLRLPELPAARLRPLRLAVSVAVGTVFAVALAGAVRGPLDPAIADYYETKSLTEAFGKNIVNVILVDFRALDTFGEIAVVAIAAIGAYALMRTRAVPPQ